MTTVVPIPPPVLQQALAAHLGTCVQCAAAYCGPAPPPDPCPCGALLYAAIAGPAGEVVE